jgi:hypothetical protein
MNPPGSARTKNTSISRALNAAVQLAAIFRAVSVAPIPTRADRNNLARTARSGPRGQQVLDARADSVEQAPGAASGEQATLSLPAPAPVCFSR